MFNVIRKLHIYLTDTNFIGYDILQKAMNAWYHSNKQFQNMIKNLIHLNKFQLPLTVCTNQQSTNENIETLINNVTRKNTIVYSTTAINEDLQQLMSMFKPYFKNNIKASTGINHIQLNKTIDHWISQSKLMMNESFNEKSIKCDLISSIDQQLSQLHDNLLQNLINYLLTDHVVKILLNKAITIMEILVTQIRFTLPSQSIYLASQVTQEFDEPESCDKHITSTHSKQTSSDHRMKLVIRLMNTINLLLPYILPIFSQSNRNHRLLNTHEIAITVDEVVMRRRLEGIISCLIEHLIQLPSIIDEFSSDYVNRECPGQSNCFQIELESWIRQYEMSRLDIMCKEFVCIDQWLPEILNNTNSCPTTTSSIRNILKNHTELGVFIHQLNYQLNCFFSELISNTSNDVSVKFPTTNMITNHQSNICQIDWIKQLIYHVIIKSKKSMIYFIDCLLAHACTTFNLIKSKKLTNHHDDIIKNGVWFNLNIEQKEEYVATIIRSLFIIDWFTEHYSNFLIESLIKDVGFKDLLYLFNTKNIISLVDKLSEITTLNLVQIKLVKCVLIALVSRLYEKFQMKSSIS
ncbi:unnamed protein product [Schistosoma turkestanicum]|nr:unnamed protein product [Schistosoma turkestanicum]